MYYKGKKSFEKCKGAGVKVWYPAPGWRAQQSSVLRGGGNSGEYWASTVNGINAYHLNFGYTDITSGNAFYRARGHLVRCLRE